MKFAAIAATSAKGPMGTPICACGPDAGDARELAAVEYLKRLATATNSN